MITIEDYNFYFEDEVLAVWTFDPFYDHKDDDCREWSIPFAKLQESFESLGFGYESESFNKTQTDVEQVMMCKKGEELDFVLDQLQNCMTSRDVQDIIKKAIEIS